MQKKIALNFQIFPRILDFYDRDLFKTSIVFHRGFSKIGGVGLTPKHSCIELSRIVIKFSWPH